MTRVNADCPGVKVGPNGGFKHISEVANEWLVSLMRTAAAAGPAVGAGRRRNLSAMRGRPDHGGLHRHPGGATMAPAVERDRVVMDTDD